jgi:hypothetical protein
LLLTNQDVIGRHINAIAFGAAEPGLAWFTCPSVFTYSSIRPDRALEHLRHDGCESACYRCLKQYQNQRHHDVLHWPTAWPYLDSLAQEPPQTAPLELGDIKGP